jgi:putative restriction endonuclease
MNSGTHDALLRQAAFDRVSRLAVLRGGILDSGDLAGGFEFSGERISLINPQRGISSPAKWLRSCRSEPCFRDAAVGIWYDNQREAHQQIYVGDDCGRLHIVTDPNSPDNRWLRDAMEQQVPVIYFLGTSRSRYQPIIPTFVVGWHPERLRVELASGAPLGASAEAALPAAPERRYALREQGEVGIRHRSEMRSITPPSN